MSQISNIYQGDGADSISDDGASDDEQNSSIDESEQDDEREEHDDDYITDVEDDNDDILSVFIIVIMVSYSQFNLMKRLVSYKTKRTVSNYGPQLHWLDYW